jgi:hypothetical protein
MADDLLNRLPMPIKVITIVGFPIAVALFYMLKDVGYLPSVAESNAKAISEILEQHKGQTGVLKDILSTQKAICHNTAKTLAEARECP